MLVTRKMQPRWPIRWPRSCPRACWPSHAATSRPTTWTVCAAPGLQAGLRITADSAVDLCSQPTVSRWENAQNLKTIVCPTCALVVAWGDSCTAAQVLSAPASAKH